MIARRVFLAAIPVILSLGPGCAMMQRSSEVVKYEPTTDPHTIETSVPARYALHSGTDSSPTVTVFVDKGEVIGFQRDPETGRVVAVAGKEKYPLATDGRHYWKRL